MSRERMILIGLAVLAGLALLFAGATAGQRSAWMEGYMMGRLSVATTGAEAGTGAAAAALLPYGPYGMGFAHRGPGFGGVLFLLLGLGAVAFFASRCVHRARWRAWMAAQGAPGGAQAEWRYGPPPWAHGPWGHGPWSAGSATSQPAGQPEPGQPPAQPPQPPAEPPAPDR
jgi:hypothetical protein